jgi:hypothetical protein
MKLQEIFDADIRNTDDVLSLDPTGDFIARGTFSAAFDDNDDPHMINKIQVKKHRHGWTDVFGPYAAIVVRDKLWNMVHFPRIYEIDHVNDSVVKWKMEKLLTMDQIRPDEFAQTMRRYFMEDDAENTIDSPHNLFYLFRSMVEMGADKSDIIKDATLIKATQKIHDVYNELRSDPDVEPTVAIDLHAGNVMYRRTHVGLELVFSDPFFAR